jgi:hypothetical protein
MSIAHADSTAVVGVFEHASAAKRAITELKNHGFLESQIGMTSVDSMRNEKTFLQRLHGIWKFAIFDIVIGLAVTALWYVGTSGNNSTSAQRNSGVVFSIAVLAAVAISLTASLIAAKTWMSEAKDSCEDEPDSGHIIVTVIAGNRADTACAVMAHHRQNETLS